MPNKLYLNLYCFFTKCSRVKMLIKRHDLINMSSLSSTAVCESFVCVTCERAPDVPRHIPLEYKLRIL